jgi:hypothetical protein
LRRDNAAEKIARAVTLRAMAEAGNRFSLLMYCLLMALWLWGFWIDNSVMPQLIDAFA